MIWKALTFILVYIFQAMIWVKIGQLKEKEKNENTKI